MANTRVTMTVSQIACDVCLAKELLGQCPSAAGRSTVKLDDTVATHRAEQRIGRPGMRRLHSLRRNANVGRMISWDDRVALP
jgi:hypothetical protein